MKKDNRKWRNTLYGCLLFVLSVFKVGETAELRAQESLEFFGYFESTLMGAELNNNINALFTNKLRVDIKSDVNDMVSFAANFDYIKYNGKTSWNILDFLSEDINSQIPEQLRGIYQMPLNDRQFLDNAYIKIAFDYFDLTAGIQQVSLGTGYVWNPTDIFNIKDPLDPTYEQPGHTAINLYVPVGDEYSIQALYSPEESWEKSGKMVRVKGRLWRFDFELTGIETEWKFHDYSMLDTISMGFAGIHEKRRLAGISTAGELFGVGTWAEYAYNFMEETDDFYELVVGADYTFDFQTYVMAEYYRNMLGKEDYKELTITDWMRQFAQEQKSVSRDQLYAMAQHPITDFISLGISVIYSISDNSAALVPTLNWSFAENLDIMAYLNTNLGEEGTVFSKEAGSGGILRARVYF